MSSALFYPSCILYSTLSKDPTGCRWRCRPGSLRPCTIHSTASRVPSVGQSTSSKHILRRRAMSIRAGSTLSASSTPDSAQHHVTLPVSSVQPPKRRTKDDQAVSSGPRDSALSNGALTRSPKHPEQVLNRNPGIFISRGGSARAELHFPSFSSFSLFLSLFPRSITSSHLCRALVLCSSFLWFLHYSLGEKLSIAFAGV